MSRILILFAHPALEKSRVNRCLADAVRGLDGVTFHDLYESYPDFFIDVGREQKLLLEHEVVLFQHPLYWYSTPPIVKQWEDLVLEHDWAYGSHGNALVGKKWATVMTSGARLEAYCPEGYNRYTIREMLRPLERSAVLCGMEFLPPYVAAGTHSMTDYAMSDHADNYRRIVEALRDNVFDFEKSRALELMNDDLQSLVPEATEVV